MKKGELVTRIARYDSEMTWYATPAEVYSAGKKRMVLNVPGSDVCLGRNFAPTEDQSGGYVKAPNSRVICSTNPVAIEEKAREMAEALRTFEVEMWENIIRIARSRGEDKYADLTQKRLDSLKAATFSLVWTAR